MQVGAVSFLKRVVLPGPDDFWTRLMVETERAAQLSLGKGSGGSGIAPEILAVERFLPETIGVVMDIGGNRETGRAMPSRAGDGSFCQRKSFAGA
jgi:hypothetical protein